jgi:hypothetical protein
MAVAATCSHAATTNYRATASGPAESPPNGSPGASIGTIELDDTAMMLRVEVPFRDLVGSATASHIHCCTMDPFTGVAPVALPFTDFPTGVTAGMYTHAFDLTDPLVYEPLFLAANGGNEAMARTTLIDGINANEAYVNIHTSRYPAGEIRGFIVTAPIPEPSEWAMLGAGLAGLAYCYRRRNKTLRLPDAIAA